jgi:hypothetical protein
MGYDPSRFFPKEHSHRVIGLQSFEAMKGASNQMGFLQWLCVQLSDGRCYPEAIAGERRRTKRPTLSYIIDSLGYLPIEILRQGSELSTGWAGFALFHERGLRCPT